VGDDALASVDAGASDSGDDATQATTSEGGPAPEAGDDASGNATDANVQMDGAVPDDGAVADASDAGVPSDAAGVTDAPGSWTIDAGPAPATDCPLDRAPVWGQGLQPSDWLAAGSIAFGAGNGAQATDATMGPVLRIQFPLGSDSTNLVNPAGMEFLIKMPYPVTSALMTYWMRFNDNFPMAGTQPGKLPGLCGGICPGSKIAGSATNGWSIRPKWTDLSVGGEYAYIVPVPNRAGYDLGQGTWTFTTGAWHHITQLMVMNSGSNADGILRVWYDVPVTSPPTYENRTITYRTDTTNVETIMFTALWVNHPLPSPVASYIDVARLEICQ
jgi:hypothetical protein